MRHEIWQEKKNQKEKFDITMKQNKQKIIWNFVPNKLQFNICIIITKDINDKLIKIDQGNLSQS